MPVKFTVMPGLDPGIRAVTPQETVSAGEIVVGPRVMPAGDSQA